MVIIQTTYSMVTICTRITNIVSSSDMDTDCITIIYEVNSLLVLRRRRNCKGKVISYLIFVIYKILLCLKVSLYMSLFDIQKICIKIQLFLYIMIFIQFFCQSFYFYDKKINIFII